MDKSSSVDRATFPESAEHGSAMTIRLPNFDTHDASQALPETVDYLVQWRRRLGQDAPDAWEDMVCYADIEDAQAAAQTFANPDRPSRIVKRVISSEVVATFESQG